MAANTANLASFTSGMSPDQVQNLANQYITAGGAKNIDNGAYWVNAYARFGSSDPGYLQTRLQQGVSDQPGYNGAFGAAGQGPSAQTAAPVVNLPPVNQSLATPQMATPAINTNTQPVQLGGALGQVNATGNQAAISQLLAQPNQQ